MPEHLDATTLSSINRDICVTVFLHFCIFLSQKTLLTINFRKKANFFYLASVMEENEVQFCSSRHIISYRYMRASQSTSTSEGEEGVKNYCFIIFSGASNFLNMHL